MKLNVKKCKHEWEYKGESKYYVTCPRCHKNINVEIKKGWRRNLQNEMVTNKKGGTKK